MDGWIAGRTYLCSMNLLGVGGGRGQEKIFTEKVMNE